MRDPETPASRSALVLARATGAAVAVVGAIHLLGWMSGATASDPSSTAITMKTNASLCLLLLGLALVASGHPLRSPARVAGAACAAVALVIGALTLAEHVTKVDLRFDQWLAQEPPGAAGVTSPNRMGPPASLSFTLLGGALLLLSLTKLPPRLRTAHQIFAGITAGLALVPTMAYLYEADELYGLARYTAIAWPTAVSVLALAGGVLLARPGAGFMAHLVAADQGGAVARRLLAPTVLLPVVLGWLRLLGERRGWFDAGMGTTLTMLVVVASLSSLVIVAGRWVSESQRAVRRRDEAARRELAEMEAIYASAHTGLAVFDRELRYLRVNERLAEINGLPAAAHLGKTVREVVPSIAPEVERIAGRILSTGEGVVGVEVSGSVPGRPGDARTWLEQWIPMKDEAGEVVRINVVVEDVTERKRAEDGLRREMAERLRAQEAGRESEARFRELADAMPQLVWMASADGKVDYYNGRMTKFVGLEQQPDRSWSWAAVLHTDDAERTLAAWQAALRTGEVYETEHRLRRADGTWRWHLSRGVPVRDASGAVRRWYGTATDIHEFKEAEASLREQDRQKTEFLAVLSHELRNPLAPIRNAVYILRAHAGRRRARRAARARSSSGRCTSWRAWSTTCSTSRASAAARSASSASVSSSARCCAAARRPAARCSRRAASGSTWRCPGEPLAWTATRTASHRWSATCSATPRSSRPPAASPSWPRPRAATRRCCGCATPALGISRERAGAGVRAVRAGGPHARPQRGRARPRSRAGEVGGRAAPRQRERRERWAGQGVRVHGAAAAVGAGGREPPRARAGSTRVLPAPGSTTTCASRPISTRSNG